MPCRNARPAIATSPSAYGRSRAWRKHRICIEFGCLAAVDRKQRGLGEPETFASGVHGKSRRGFFQLQRKTRRDPGGRSFRTSRSSCDGECSGAIPKQGKWLRHTVGGHFAYIAVPTNIRALTAFGHQVTDLWRRTLQRRSQKDGAMWGRIAQLADDHLPKRLQPSSIAECPLRRQKFEV